MPENIAKTIVENSLGYVWFLFMAVWGGTVSYISRLKKHKCCFSVAELIGEWTISGFTGILTAYICTFMKLEFYQTAFAVGIAGHLGGRGLFMFESILKSKINKIVESDNEGE